MSAFAFYFARNLLHEMGWPRKLGRFKGEGYDAFLVDQAYDRAFEVGAGLGAERPALALQMMADCLRASDWDGDNPPNIQMYAESCRENWGTAVSPEEVVRMPRFADGMKTVSVEQFGDRQRMTAMQPYFLDVLMWGLSYPARFEAWYESTAAHMKSELPKWQDAGLEVEEMEPLAQFIGDSEQIVRDYERDVGPLPAIPSKLLADAKLLGWRV